MKKASIKYLVILICMPVLLTFTNSYATKLS